MKISVNDKELVTLNETQKKVLAHEIPHDELEKDLKRRIVWVVMHAYEQYFKRLKNEWDKKLAANGVTMIPTDKDAYAQLVFSQAEYKDRAARDVQAEAALKVKEEVA